MCTCRFVIVLVLCCTPPDEILLLVFHRKSNKQLIFSFTKHYYKRIILKDTLFEDVLSLCSEKGLFKEDYLMKTEVVKMLFDHF